MSGYYSERLSAERLKLCYELAPPPVQRYLEKPVSTDVLLTQALLLGSALSRKVGNPESQSNAVPVASAGAAPNEKQAGAGASTAPAAEKK